MMVRPRSRRAFTIIELKVVITIIDILILKRIGQAMMMYGQDYDQMLFLYRTRAQNPYAGQTGSGRTLFSQLLNLYIKNDGVWKCPSKPRAWVNIDTNGAASETEPAF